ncbi:MAG: hypothetical protein U0871_26080 [Gemmataceae bacterium]
MAVPVPRGGPVPSDVICLGQAGVDDLRPVRAAAVEQLTAGWRTRTWSSASTTTTGTSCPTRSAGSDGTCTAAAARWSSSPRPTSAYRRQFAAPLPNARLIRNPVNLTDRTSPPGSAAEPKVVFGFVGWLDARHKGLDLLLEALVR